MRRYGHSVTGKTMKPDAQASPARPLFRTGARPLSLVATAAFVLLVLSACSPPASPPSDTKPPNGNTQPPEAGTPPEVGNPSTDLMSAAARNAPRAGSVTQGSRGEAGTTADRVRWTGSGVRIENRLLTQDVTGDLDPVSGLRYFTDRSRNAVAAVVSSVSSGSDGQPRPHFDTSDAVVFGPWMYRTPSDQFVWGMFADGLANEADATPVPGTYRGTTIGVYTDAAGIVDFFTARVELELAEDESLTGTIDQVRSVDGGPVQIGDALPTIALEIAGAAPVDGLRKGDTAFLIGGARQQGASGKWGAAFFEDGVAAGTWGVTTDNPFPFSVVGAFSATRQ